MSSSFVVRHIDSDLRAAAARLGKLLVSLGGHLRVLAGNETLSLLQNGVDVFDCLLVGCQMIIHVAINDSILQINLLLFLGVRVDELVKCNVVENLLLAEGGGD